MASEIKVDTIVNAGGDNDSGIDLATNDNIKFNIAGSQKAVIESNGRLGIGTTSPDTPLTIDGGSTDNTVAHFKSGTANTYIKLSDSNTSNGVFVGATTDDMTLFSNNTERMRITANGNFSFGANTVSNIETTILMTMTGNGSNADHYYEVGPHYTGDPPAFYTINESGTGVVLSHGNTSWSTHSDERIKENITSLENVLPDIKNVRCVKYNLKGQTDTKIGFIAQDWESKFPEVVEENVEQVIETDGSVSMAEHSESKTVVKIMQYTETIPVLLKSIQELLAKVETLEAKVKELESK